MEPWLFVVQKVRAGNINVVMRANRNCENEYQRTRSLTNTCTARKRRLGILERAFKNPIPCLMIPSAPSQCILPILHSHKSLCCFRGLCRRFNKLSSKNCVPETAGHAETQLVIFPVVVEVVFLKLAVV